MNRPCITTAGSLFDLDPGRASAVWLLAPNFAFVLTWAGLILHLPRTRHEILGIDSTMLPIEDPGSVSSTLSRAGSEIDTAALCG